MKVLHGTKGGVEVQVEWFESFVETVHMKSLSKAGEKLNISQTALSKQIKNLEDSFGVSLFHRSATGMELTPEGTLLYEKVQQWLSDIAETKRRLHNYSSTKRMVCGSLPSLAAHYLPERLMRLKADGVQVDLRVFNTSADVYDAFVNGQVDVAIVERNFTIPKIYFAVDLFTEPYFAVLPVQHRLSEVPGLRVSDLQDEPLILYPPKCDVRQSITSSFADHDFTPNISAEVPFGESILGFVAAGAGITIVPETIATHLGNGLLTVKPILDFGRTRTIRLVAKSAEQARPLQPYFRSGQRQRHAK